MKRSHLQIALYMLAVFISGAVVGALAHRLYMVKTVTAEPRRRSPEEFRRKYIDDMRATLRLNETQSTRLNEILDHTGARFKAFRDQHKAETDAIHDEQVREINAMLDDSQKVEYENFRKQREKKRRESEGKP